MMKRFMNYFMNIIFLENVLLQHEYLHQVSFEEVFQYIEKLIKQDSKKITVYHGSCFKFDQIDLNKSHNRRDFAKGFYTTNINVSI